MGYQITQLYDPIIKDGKVTFGLNGESKTVRIHEAHLEADAGKSTHPAGADYSLVDLNRAGTPLLEIVSEPDMHSADEAKAYARELYLAMLYADVSYANLYYGNMRFDVNVSVSKTSELGLRTETKNLNSFRSVHDAVEYEIDRQIELLENGEKVIQETRGWDDAKGVTFSQRSKEDAHDYRYMPDPDLPPIVLNEAYVNKIRESMPMLPSEYREKFAGIGLDEAVVEDILAVPETAKLVLRILETAGPEHAKRIAFWTMTKAENDDTAGPASVRSADDERSESGEGGLTSIEAVELPEKGGAPSDKKIEVLVKLSHMVSDNKLSSTAAKEVFAELQRSGGDPERIAETKNLLQVSDEGAIAEIVAQVLSENEAAVNDVRSGEMKAIGFLVGQVMKASQGKANPALATSLIKKQIGV